MNNQRTLEVERTTSTAHRLLHYDGVCGCVHGHNFKWEIEAQIEMDPNDDDNMPVDLKDIADLIDDVDHAILLNADDPLNGLDEETGALGEVWAFKDGDPTCEVVAQWMVDRILDEFDPVTYVNLTLYETDKYGVQTTASRDP